MESFRNERKVQQGENWNLDLLLSASNREYIPFIISSDRSNPYFVVTVASTKFEKNLRYVKSFWNNVKAINPVTHDYYLPQFYGTNLIDCGVLATGASLPTQPGQGTFSTYTVNDTKARRYLYSYTRENDNTGATYYFYFTYNYESTSTAATGRSDNYSCRVTFNFPSEVTAEWTGQNYLYQVTLVSGLTMDEKLAQLKTYHTETIADYPADKWPELSDYDDDESLSEEQKKVKLREAQYTLVKTNWPNDLQPDIDIDSPLGKIENPIPILAPTKLEVFNNLRTLI